MADGFVQVEADSTGKKVDTEQLTGGTHRQRSQVAGALLLEVAEVKNADLAHDAYGLGVRPAGPLPALSTSGTLDGVTDTITQAIRGRKYASAAFGDQTAFDGTIGFKVVNGEGAEELRTCWDGNRWIGVATFPNGLGAGEPGVTFSIGLEPSDTSVILYVGTYTSGTVEATLTVSDTQPMILGAGLALGIDGGNPAGSASESPGSLSVGGKDAASTTIHRTASLRDEEPTATDMAFVVRTIVPRAATGTRSQVADSASDGIILAANSARRAAAVFNDSTVVLYLGLGTTVTTATNYTVQIAAGGYYEAPECFTGQIRGIWASDPGTGGAKVTELTT